MIAGGFQPVRIHHQEGWIAGIHAQTPAPRACVLVVPPFPHEWQRGYRLFALLAHALSELGVASLRFDPTGCGDSSGEDSEFGMERLINDAGCALAWLRASQSAPVTLLGVRAGALAASALAAQTGVDWIGWQSVETGADYLETLRERDAAELNNSRRFGVRPPGGWGDEGCLLGHRTTSTAIEQLRAARLRTPARSELAEALPAGLRGWVQEIDLSSPFPLPQVRAAAQDLARRLGVSA